MRLQVYNPSELVVTCRGSVTTVVKHHFVLGNKVDKLSEGDFNLGQGLPLIKVCLGKSKVERVNKAGFSSLSVDKSQFAVKQKTEGDFLVSGSLCMINLEFSSKLTIVNAVFAGHFPLQVVKMEDRWFTKLIDNSKTTVQKFEDNETVFV